MGLWDSFIRWRHSKGFGVHSPFAYRFVTDVLRPGPYRYYSYHEIDRQLSGAEFHDHRLLRLIRFTIRLAIFLKAKRIVAYARGCRMAEVAANALGLDFIIMGEPESFNFREGDFLVIDNSLNCRNASSGAECQSPAKINPAIINKALDAGVAVFCLHPSLEVRDIMEKPIERGLLLNDTSRMILIPRREMAYTAYRVRLKIR